MELSKYQKAIEKNYLDTNKNIVIDAVPGAGKSFTLKHLLSKTSIGKETTFVAFNKSIVRELESELPSYVDVNTLHSLGCKALYRLKKGKVKVDKFKIYKICRSLSKKWDNIPPKKLEGFCLSIVKIVELFRYRLETNYEAIDSIINYYDIPSIADEKNKAIEVIEKMNKQNKSQLMSVSKKLEIDFTDMIYLPVTLSDVKLKQYDNVFVDEVQDLNRAQQELVMMIIKPNGRFVCAGDKRQAIYGFMSSDVNSYQNFVDIENTIELPLSYCYRCQTSVVQRANTIYDVIESPDFMGEGEVLENQTIDDIIDNVKDGDFVLCRNTKPLVQLYFVLIGEEIYSYIRGSDIGKGLLKLINEYKGKSVEFMLNSLSRNLTMLVSELRSNGVKKPTKHPKYASLDEKIEIIKIFSSKYNTSQQVIDSINRVFKDSGEGVCLSTIHKSKGLESDNVYLYKPSLIPSKFATKPWQIEQENNLLYVAYTRAKKKLSIVI